MPLHLPGHNFAGPGTDVEKQLREGKYPVNYLDWASLLHDIDYGSHKSTKDADSEFIERLEQDDTITGTAVKHLFKGKQFVDKYIYDTDKIFRPDYMPPIKKQKTNHHTDILQGRGYVNAETAPLPPDSDDDVEMSDESNGPAGAAPDATRDEPDGKRRRGNDVQNDGGATNGSGRNGNPNTGISDAADPYAGHQDKLQYIDVEFWENIT